MKRPYLTLEVFKFRNYTIGAILVFLLYICRGTMSVTTTYFSSVLGMDPIHVGYTMIPNMIGIILSIVISSRLIVLHKPMRFIWMSGFLTAACLPCMDALFICSTGRCTYFYYSTCLYKVWVRVCS